MGEVDEVLSMTIRSLTVSPDISAFDELYSL